ncbi:ATP-binding region ATPase domain protein [Catenulispora acidiphila DSM 44928]|uniref:histidine kinase n=1 Tax=Catenulispora acidiphila (strain DSM 44928 / JCM 14897 / NBRC 102108 / NRRL B-24433 / ID139908) TaxID=479433 RepID=C7Q4C6_CATAD|nr:ATP-binding protein [Catenulispora acidiphila]ACU69986.1 ATP-binding region ATPase domain protein [Catenulispora acidiphila DSM 44928]
MAVGLALAVGGGCGAAVMWAMRGVGSAHPEIEIAVVAAFGLIALVLAFLMMNPAHDGHRTPRHREREMEALRARLEAAWTAHLGQLLVAAAERLARDRPEIEVQAVESGLATGGIAGIEAAITALVAPAAYPSSPEASQIQADASMTIARRVLALIVRVLRQLDALERETEDPAALKSLFVIDEQVTRIRRAVETLAVFGGVAPRTATRPVAVNTVLRQAVAEIEDYRRVQILPPALGRVHGVAAADIIHLIAELVENAAKFSRPGTEVTVRVQEVSAGIAIDIDDRGLGMDRQECERVCALLAGLDPEQAAQRLRDGQLGYLASARFAARHGIAVRVSSNVVGGLHALVLLPHAVLEAGPVVAEPVVEVPREYRTPVAVIPEARSAVLTPAAHRAVAQNGSAQPARTIIPGGRPPLPRREGSYLLPQPATPETASPESARGDSGEAAFTPGLLAGYRNGYQSGVDTWTGEDGTNEYEPPREDR